MSVVRIWQINANDQIERISTLLDCIAEQQDRKLGGSLMGTPVDKQKPRHVMLAFLYLKLYVLMTDYICLHLPFEP